MRRNRIASKSLPLRPSAPPFVAGMVRNPNACGADRAEPVWGSTLAPLGYTCSHNENGG